MIRNAALVVAVAGHREIGRGVLVADAGSGPGVVLAARFGAGNPATGTGDAVVMRAVTALAADGAAEQVSVGSQILRPQLAEPGGIPRRRVTLVLRLVEAEVDAYLFQAVLAVGLAAGAAGARSCRNDERR